VAEALQLSHSSIIDAPAAPASDDPRPTFMWGLAIVIGFFGLLGGWAALAPLDGAVVGDGVVMVEGNRKSVEHLEGGIIKDIRVREGDKVAAGDTLVVLDDAPLRAQADIYAQQLAVARATEARLAAELRGDATISFPADLADSAVPYVQQAVTSQADEFAARRAALLGGQQSLGFRIENFRQQIAGKEARQKALEAQLASVNAEEETLRGLVDQKLATRSRMLDLQRASAAVAADEADNLAAIASAQQSIAETQQQILQLESDRRAEVAADLDKMRSRILDLGPALSNANAALGRTVVQAPYAGRVVNLRVFSTGAVINPGGTLLDIVPDSTGLVVQARIRVEDILEVAPGATSELHFATYKRMYVPVMAGTVTTVSADRLTDERTGIAYYTAQVVVDPKDLRRNPDIALYPGMPVQVMVKTERRTALDYMLSPLFAAFDGAFRQN
jgi:epimerase transport system membrane fusion protein